MSERDPKDDHWEIYVTFVDDKSAIILVDIGVHDQVPIKGLATLVWVWVPVLAPDEDGFPSEEEDDRLNDIEDALVDAIDVSSTRYVGRIATDGRREFYFYSQQPDELATTLANAMQTFTDYKSEIEQADDPAWQHYLDVLYPSPEDFHQIHNQHVITQLQMGGDSLTVPRPVDHYANFKTAEDRELFIATASGIGYEVASRPDRQTDADFPFAVGLLRVDSVDPETIDRITFELFELAERHNGEYEGWGSKVTKSS